MCRLLRNSLITALALGASSAWGQVSVTSAAAYCMTFVQGDIVRSGPPVSQTFTTPIDGEGILTVTVHVEGAGATSAKSCTTTLARTSVSQIDEGLLTALADQMGLLKLTLKVPGFAYGDCHEPQPMFGLTVMPGKAEGVQIRTVQSPAMGRVCVQNYGMQ